MASHNASSKEYKSLWICCFHVFLCLHIFPDKISGNLNLNSCQFLLGQHHRIIKSIWASSEHETGFCNKDSLSSELFKLSSLFLATFTSLIRILLNRKYSYQLNKFRSKSAFDCGGEKSKITSLTIFTSLTISTSLTIFTSLTVFNSSTIFTSVTIITSSTILVLVGNLDHQVAPLALVKNLADRWRHLY